MTGPSQMLECRQFSTSKRGNGGGVTKWTYPALFPRKPMRFRYTARKTTYDSRVCATCPETSFRIRSPRRFPVHPPQSPSAAQASSGGVSLERHSRTHPDRHRGQPRNQHRDCAGALTACPAQNRACGRFRRHGASAIAALANSLLANWTAESRVLHLTGWGTRFSQNETLLEAM